MMRLYLVRHPQPEVGAGICYGSTDLAVSHQECERAVSALSVLLPRAMPVFSSPLRRCSELADRLAVALGSPPVLHDSRLVEMHFGDWEMRAWNDIDRAQVDAWAADPTAYRPGGGESVLQAAQRVHAFHEEMRECRQDAIVVCHAGTIRLLLACQRGGSLGEIALHAAQARHSIAYGQSIVVNC